jgi:hypothetical protein
MKARLRGSPATDAKLPTATKRVRAGLTANRRTSVAPAFAATEPVIRSRRYRVSLPVAGLTTTRLRLNEPPR